MNEDVPAIRVDYSESYTAAHLFRDIAVHYMASPDGQTTLVHAGLERSIPGLPTWVLDWSTAYRSSLATGIYNACLRRFGIGEDILAAVKVDEATGRMPVQSTCLSLVGGLSSGRGRAEL
jgi:hypothetical protein